MEQLILQHIKQLIDGSSNNVRTIIRTNIFNTKPVLRIYLPNENAIHINAEVFQTTFTDPQYYIIIRPPDLSASERIRIDYDVARTIGLPL